MAFITEPTVRLVSRTEVNWEAVSAFLEQEGVPPVPESIRAGNDESAAVVEISARVCYMSYGKAVATSRNSLPTSSRKAMAASSST